MPRMWIQEDIQRLLLSPSGTYILYNLSSCMDVVLDITLETRREIGIAYKIKHIKQ